MDIDALEYVAALLNERAEILSELVEDGAGDEDELDRCCAVLDEVRRMIESHERPC